MGTKLPRRLEQKMQIVGEQIRLARLRRNLSIAQIAERATLSLIHISEPTRLLSISYAVFCLKKKKKQYRRIT